MPRQMDQARLEKEIRESWFKNHAATCVVTEMKLPLKKRTITVINWADPDSICYYVRYILMGGHLFVGGDLGEATYLWNQEITPAFLARCSLDYFQGKCVASEVGRRFVEWNESLAQQRLASYIEDLKKDLQGDEEAIKKLEEQTHPEFDHYEDSMGSKEEWWRWLGDHNEGIFSDPEGLYEIGNEVHPRCISHWIGIQMAVEQLSKKETVVVEP